MTRTGFIWLAVAFALAFVALGIPYWRIPYNQFDLGHTEMLPGAVLLGALTMLLILAEAARGRWILLAMLMCGPAVDLVSILRDTAVDPTTHNLAPFELIIALVLGAGFVLPGAVAGVVARSIARRLAGSRPRSD